MAKILLVALLLAFVELSTEIRLKSNRTIPRLHRNYNEKDYDFKKLPKSFDWRHVHGRSYVTIDRNQHLPQYCGSCWAHAASSSIADRLFIQKNGTYPEPIISIQEIIDCAHAGSCSGGNEEDVFEYAKKKGLVHETCNPYQAIDQNCTKMHRCYNCWLGEPCHPVKKYTVYKIKDYGSLENNINHIKAEIFHHGPIACSMSVQESLKNYTKGIVTGPDGPSNHAVSVAGWGVEKGKEYWIVRNSWGTFWGEKGWFKIATSKSARGNNLSIEEGCSYPIVDKTSITYVQE